MTTAQTNELAKPKPPRLWLGVLIVVLQWLAWLIVPRVVPEATLCAMMGAVLGGGLVVTSFTLPFHTGQWECCCPCIPSRSYAWLWWDEVLCPKVAGDRWDQHSNLKDGHENNARAVDKPIAGLLKDLKSRGMLDETLVIWASEFGRTPMAQGSDGRDHNPFGFSIWLAGGGVKGGIIHGATDDYGYFIVENKVEIHDLHATMLHLLGLDHKKLTYRF